jgi:hypothetical protein
MLRKLVFTLLAVVIAGSVWVSAVAAGQDKVTVCHKPGTPAEATLEIAAPAEAAHLGHGDYAGECKGPQSDGCTALNALVPDPQMDPSSYFLWVMDLGFFPGETIHVSTTVEAEVDTAPGASGPYAIVAVLTSVGGPLAVSQHNDPSGLVTVSIDYVVVDLDDAGVILVESDSGSVGEYIVRSVDISCTPAP